MSNKDPDLEAKSVRNLIVTRRRALRQPHPVHPRLVYARRILIDKRRSISLF